MRAAEAEPSMVLSVRDEHRGKPTGSAVAKVKVVRTIGHGWIRVRVLETHFGTPQCLGFIAPDAQERGERKVLSRFCWPWNEHMDRQIADRTDCAAAGKRRREELEGVVKEIGVGTVAPNGRAFFGYEEMVLLARRLGLAFTTGGDES